MEFTNRQLIIMHHLAQGNTVTAQELALSSNVSIRTIKKEIQILREILKSYQIEVSSIPGHGYRLNPLDEDQEEKIFENIGSISLIRRMNSFSRNNSERVSYLIRTLLEASDYLKIEDLAERMFVSRTTIHNDLKDVRLQLRRFQLELKSRPAYGLKLTGSEFNLRLAFAEYFFHNTLSLVESKEKEPFILNKDTLFKTEEIVKESCFKVNILLSDFSLQNIAVHILILFKRRREGHRIDIHKTTDSLLLPLAQTIANAVSTLLNEDVLEKPELLYLAIHLDSKQIIAHSGKTDAQDEALIYDIFTEIDNNFAINFLDNHELFRYLLLHIPQMIKRIQNGLTIRNPLIHRNLREFLFAAKVTISAVSVIEANYPDISINLDEFGYLLLYFQGALMTRRHQQTLNIGFIGGNGRSETIVYGQTLREYFKNDHITVSVYGSLQEITQDLDIGVSMAKMSIPQAREVVAIEDGNYLTHIEQKIKQFDLAEADLDHYLKPQYVIYNLRGNNKEQVLHNLTDTMNTMNLLKPHYDSNPFATHEIGHNLVHLQDLKKHVDRALCFVAVLEKPIIWDKSEVHVLFLIKTKRDGDHDLFYLCDRFSKWSMDRFKVQQLIEGQSFDDFKQALLSS